MALSPDQRTGNPPGPAEMMSASLDVRVALSRASLIAMQRKDREVGMGHLALALDYDPRLWVVLKEHGFSRDKAENELKKN